MSLDLLHATNTREPSADGCAHVGEQPTSPGFGCSIPCPPVEVVACAATPGAPFIPCSLPGATMKCRAAFSSRVSISTIMSSIMHAEYCFVPCGLMREPCGIVQVWMRATSTMGSVATTETDDGTMSPCRLKFTTKANAPSGVTCTVAGKLPSITRPATESPSSEYFHRKPKGVPCAVDTKRNFLSGDSATPWGPS